MADGPKLTKSMTDRPLPKRFYKAVSLGEGDTILLDGRAVKTPMKALLHLPNRALAEAVAGEWQAQESIINPALMPLTKLAYTAIDRVRAERAAVEKEVVSFAGNDLVCYRAEAPEALVALQAEKWNPVLAWAKAHLGHVFHATHGLTHMPQDKEALDAVARGAARLDDFTLAAVHEIMVLTGSALIALMVHWRALSADDAWKAAHVDEDWQIRHWGEDHDAAQRRAFRKREFEAAAQWLAMQHQ